MPMYRVTGSGAPRGLGMTQARADELLAPLARRDTKADITTPAPEQYPPLEKHRVQPFPRK